MSYIAVNAFIFAGSFSIGVMNAGFNLKKVLEMTDDMLEKNAFFLSTPRILLFSSMVYSLYFCLCSAVAMAKTPSFRVVF